MKTIQDLVRETAERATAAGVPLTSEQAGTVLSLFFQGMASAPAGDLPSEATERLDAWLQLMSDETVRTR